MIDAKDIMIGNWFSHNGSWNYCGHKGYFQFTESDWYAIGECTLFLEDVDYIPLSEEILLALGFEKVIEESEDFYGIEYHLQVNEDVFISYSEDFSCGIWESKKRMEEFGVLPKWENVKYVHGLQNLVWILTGQELEIKL